MDREVPRSDAAEPGELVRALEVHRLEIAREFVERMFRDPFWAERFGPLGRRVAEEDGLYHLSYLMQALGVGDPAVLADYARWLRSVLTARGLCSRHLAESFRAIAETVRERGLPEAERAAEFLAIGARALEYEYGPGAALDRIAAPALARVLGNLEQAQCAEAAVAARPRRSEHLGFLLSYLADALAANRVEIFERYIAFSAGVFGRHGVTHPEFDARLRLLGDAIEGLLAPESELRGRCVELLTAARGIAATFWVGN